MSCRGQQLNFDDVNLRCMMVRLFFLLPIIFFLVGCTSVEVRPLQYDAQNHEIILIDNPKVIVHDFVPIMEQFFSQHGIALKRASQFTQLGEKEYGIRYSAKQSWDFTTYLSDAYVNVYRGNMLVAYGKYHLIGGSACLSLFKWQGTETKMGPVLDELLKNYPTARDGKSGRE